MNHIGIDLAWTYKNETGICVLDNNGEVLHLESKVYTDDEIVHIVDRFSKEGAIVSIDAPIVVKNMTGSRDAERLLMRERIHGRRISLFVASRGYLIRNYGSIRGEVLANKIIDRNDRFKITYEIEKEMFGIIETFPSGICLSAFPEICPIKYKINRKIPFEETKLEMERIIDCFKKLENEENKVSSLVKHFNINIRELNKKEFKHIEDKIDAFLCAYSSYSIITGKTENRVYGNHEDGFIVLPFVRDMEENIN
ncbi:DUF429 domain-containing protein [Anaeromicrobium sediminis]|uniref:DUF429 domain-containing protein n=1 Tax=Anaeromicrobium sediminis TaxID=1478221 RepID=A0A267MIT0_9FIRM|nr:DUF429 domain-containing protein [Anaeromicrobium sediminis]PAB59491.1 hypothetical protein CCE28_09755 [Anaeromicrobium sediminis]